MGVAVLHLLHAPMPIMEQYLFLHLVPEDLKLQSECPRARYSAIGTEVKRATQATAIQAAQVLLLLLLLLDVEEQQL